VAQGSPEQVAGTRSHTGAFLRDFLRQPNRGKCGLSPKSASVKSAPRAHAPCQDAGTSSGGN
jgi:hypothetical protein